MNALSPFKAFLVFSEVQMLTIFYVVYDQVVQEEDPRLKGYRIVGSGRSGFSHSRAVLADYK